MNSQSKCEVCDDPESFENPIFICEDCGMGVHMLCYGIETPSKNCADPWWCSPCTSGLRRTICELCLKTGGALKKTTCGKYVHVLCGLFTQNVSFVNKSRMEPVNISNDLKENRGKECVYCREKRGICCKCSQLNCEHFFHVPCAKANNALKEIPNPKNNKLVFASYCREHKKTDSSRRISSDFVMKSMEADSDQDETDQMTYDIIDNVDFSSDTNVIGASNSDQGTEDDDGVEKDDNHHSLKSDDVSSDNSAIGASYTDGNGDENDDCHSTQINDEHEAGPSGLSTNHESINSTSAIGTIYRANDAKNIENGDINGDEDLFLKSVDIVSDNANNIANAANDFAVRGFENSDSNEMGLSDVATSHESNYDMDNDDNISNRFWWDYHELQAELRSKDEKIEKVKDLIVSLKKNSLEFN